MKLSRILAVLCVAGLVAAGCNGDAPAPDAEPTEQETAPDTTAESAGDAVTVETLDNEFSPAEFEVATGDVEVTLDNTGQNPHTFTSEELGVDEEVAPGEQAAFTLSGEPGTYDFICAFHESLGMVGTVTVTE